MPPLHRRMIHFTLLKNVGLRGLDETRADQLLRQPKRLALLAYLVSPAPGTWHRRDTLLTLFWPELDTAHARTSLRNALYVLRNALGEQILRSRGDEEVAVEPELLTTDLAALWNALRDARPAEALALYGGELLPGLFSPDSDGFQRWLETERARLRIEVAKAGLTHATELERAGDLADALRVLRRVLEIHPDDETAVRRLMALHDVRGDRVGALAAFEDYRVRLARDFEAHPAPETVALAERMRGPSRMADERPPAPPLTRSSSANDLPTTAGARAPDHSPSGAPIPEELRVRRRRRLLLSGAAILAIVIAGARLSRSTPMPSIGKSTPLTFDAGLQIEPAIAPNGRLVAYAKGDARRMRIFIQRLGGGPPYPLSGDSSSVEIMPRWSPDNDQLLFLSRNSAYVSPAIGGAPRLVAAGGADEATVRSASWTPNGDSALIVRHDSLLVLPLEGLGARFVGRGRQIHSCLASPDGRWIACVSGNTVAFIPGTVFGNRAPSAIVIFPAAGGAPVAVTDTVHESRSPAWSSDGRSLWFLSNRDGRDGEVYAVAIGNDGRPAGELRRMGLAAESISLSAARLAYSVYARSANIWSVPMADGRVRTTADATRVTSGNQIIEVVRVSRDGKWLVYDSNLRGNSDIYRLRIGDRGGERITDDPREEFAGDLSPDGSEVVYQLWVGPVRRLFVKQPGTGVAREALAAPGDQAVARWAPDGSALAFWDHSREPGSIKVVRRDTQGRWGANPRRLVEAQLPIWSPDGQAVVFVTSAGAVGTIAADSGVTRLLYSPGAGATDPRATYLTWDQGRSEIWLLGHTDAGGSGIWALPARGGKPRLLVDLRDPSGRMNGPSLSSDGTRFYFTLDERSSNVHVAELEQR